MPAPGVDCEILVADGGGSDATRVVAEAAGARWIECPQPGRGAQMNHGASLASGNTLIFSHADTRFLAGACEALRRALERDVLVGGAFQRRFVHGSKFLDFACALADLRGRWPGWFLGDQSIFVRTEVFVRLGGYRDWSAFEDLDLSRRMARQGQTCLIRPGVLSSGRRFGSEPVRRSLKDLAMTLRFIAAGSRPPR